MAKYVAPDRKGQKEFGHTCSVPSRAKWSSITYASGMPVASTNLKRDLGNTKDSLCNWVQLLDVNFSLVPCGSRTAYLCEDNAIFNRPVHRLLYPFAHHWSVFLQQSFEFMERRA